MKTKGIVLFVLGFFLGVSAGVTRGQSLADIARKEREKRQTQPKAVKVYTNDNLPRGASLEDRGADTGRASSSSLPETSPSTQSQPVSATPAPEQQSTTTSSTEKPAEDKKKTKEYWQALFESARADLAKAEDARRLSEDELTLAQMNEARELDPQRRNELGQEVAAKLSAADAKRAAEEKAKQAVDELLKKFDESGAPKEWIPADQK